MIEELSIEDARRVALAAQGFDRKRPEGRADARHIRRAIRQMGLIQIDYVNVLVPAHYMVLFSRLGPYDRAKLDELVYRRREFTEQWAHEASLVPCEIWPLLRRRMEADARRTRALDAFAAQHGDYLERVLKHVHERGPLTADRMVEPDGTQSRRTGSWWGWSAGKTALERLFVRGSLAIADRRSPDTARSYDLAERVIPPEHYSREVSHEDAHRELLGLAARSHGLGTVADLADYYRIPVREARVRIAELLEQGELREVRVPEVKDRVYMHRDAKAPRRVQAAALLSPFDPLVWYRPRASWLFGFDYRIEIYTPQAQRKWGYYVLPFLFDERIAARVDLLRTSSRMPSRKPPQPRLQPSCGHSRIGCSCRRFG
jgi:uncharacterized protein YcaQ